MVCMWFVCGNFDVFPNSKQNSHLFNSMGDTGDGVRGARGVSQLGLETNVRPCLSDNLCTIVDRDFTCIN